MDKPGKNCDENKQKSWDNFIKSLDLSIDQLDKRQPDLDKYGSWITERYNLRRKFLMAKRNVLQYQKDIANPKYQTKKNEDATYDTTYANRLLWNCASLAGCQDKFNKPEYQDYMKRRGPGIIRLFDTKADNIYSQFHPLEKTTEAKKVKIWKYWFRKAYFCEYPRDMNNNITVEKFPSDGDEMIEKIILQDHTTIQLGIKALTDVIGE